MTKKRQSSNTLPSPAVLKRAAQAILYKCNIPKGSVAHEKLKKHRSILRKLAALKGNAKTKKLFIRSHKKQVGGILPLLPLILSLVGGAVPGIINLARGR